MAEVAMRSFSSNRPASAISGKRTVATRFEALEQNALRNLQMLNEHRRGIDTVVQRRQDQARAQARELEEFSKKLLKPVSVSMSGVPSPRGGNLSDRCFVLEDTALRNQVLLASHREALDSATQARQERARKMEHFAAQLNEAWGESTDGAHHPVPAAKAPESVPTLDMSTLESNMKRSQEALEERCRRMEEHIQEMTLEYERRKAMRRPAEVGADPSYGLGGVEGEQAQFTGRSSRTGATPRTEEEKLAVAENRRSMLFGAKNEVKAGAKGTSKIDLGATRLRQRPSSVCSMKARCHAITHNLHRNQDQLQTNRQELKEAHRRQQLVNEQAAATAKFMEEMLSSMKR
mmetsp:Transcript_46695/g.111057  ORF Transcript_46695/g.111057 Transcript_46695/m.111057 type:complete len:348 (-) Transcript_46695:208-1251(-)